MKKADAGLDKAETVKEAVSTAVDMTNALLEVGEALKIPVVSEICGLLKSASSRVTASTRPHQQRPLPTHTQHARVRVPRPFSYLS